MTARRACCSSGIQLVGPSGRLGYAGRWVTSGRRACLCYRTDYVSYPACSTSALTPTQPTVRGCPNPNLACGLLCYRTAYGKHVSHYSTGCIRSRRVVHVKHISPKKKKLHDIKKNLVTFMQTRDMYLHFTRSNIWANGNN